MRARISHKTKVVCICLVLSAKFCDKGYAQSPSQNYYELGFIPISVEEIDVSFQLVKKWKLSGQMDAQLETQGTYTNGNPFAYAQRFVIRPWVEYSGLKNLRLWLGYAHIKKYAIAETNNYDILERRVTLMGSLTQNLPKGNMFEQLRFETRLFDDQNDIHRTILRIRTRFGVNHFLAQNNPNSWVRSPNISYYAEVILRFTDKDYAPDHFDTFKLFVYYSAGLTKNLHFLLGAIGQLQLRTNGQLFDLYYGPQLTFKWNFAPKQRETFEDVDGKSD